MFIVANCFNKREITFQGFPKVILYHFIGYGLWKFNRWFVVIAFIIGAILTPSPDPVAQVIMALPMVILYNISILIAYIVTKRKEKKARAEGAYIDSPDDDPDDKGPAAKPGKR